MTNRGRLRELRLHMVQCGDVVDLVESVHDCLVADRHVPLEDIQHDHVLHAEVAEVSRDLRADPLGEWRGFCGTSEVDPDETAPLLDRNRWGAHIAQVLLGEVLTLGHADQFAGGVVYPAVVLAAESAGAAALRLGNERNPAVLADVVKRGQRTVGLAGDHHGLTVLTQSWSSHPGWCTSVPPGGDEPAAVQHLLAFELEAHRVCVRVA